MTSREVLALLGAGTLVYHGVELLGWIASRIRASARLHRFGNLGLGGRR